MEKEYLKEQQYLSAKKRVKEIKGFYSHLLIYVLINIFISGIIIFGLTYNNISLSESFKRKDTFFEATSNFEVIKITTTSSVPFETIIAGLTFLELKSLKGKDSLGKEIHNAAMPCG